MPFPWGASGNSARTGCASISSTRTLIASLGAIGLNSKGSTASLPPKPSASISHRHPIGGEEGELHGEVGQAHLSGADRPHREALVQAPTPGWPGSPAGFLLRCPRLKSRRRSCPPARRDCQRHRSVQAGRSPGQRAFQPGGSPAGPPRLFGRKIGSTSALQAARSTRTVQRRHPPRPFRRPIIELAVTSVPAPVAVSRPPSHPGRFAKTRPPTTASASGRPASG